MSKTKDKPLIYVAEPSRVLSKIISTELEKLGYEVHSFDDGFSVLKSLISETPKLLITDKQLPKIDGMELCNIIKSGSSKNDIPIILISGIIRHLQIRQFQFQTIISKLC